MFKILAIGLGGFIGAIMRYGISGWVYEKVGENFPHGTLVVNLIGSLILGFFMALSESRIQINPVLKVTITIGVLGALTTFSTFSYETFSLLQMGQVQRAFINISVSVLLGLLAIWLGIIAAKFI